VFLLIAIIEYYLVSEMRNSSKGRIEVNSLKNDMIISLSKNEANSASEE